MTGALDLRPRRRARGGGSAVRGRHGRGGPAADLGATRRVGDRPSGRHDRGLGRRQLRPARGRPRGAARARRRPAAPAAPVEGRAGRGSPRRRCHRAGHDLPFRWHPGDLRGTASRRAAAVGRRHDPDRRRARTPRARPRAGGSPSSTRSPTPTHSRPPSGSTPRADIRGLDPDASPYVVVASQGIWDEEAVAAGADPRCVVRRAGRLADAGRRRPRVAPRGDDARRRADRRPARAGRHRPRARRPPRRSRCRSSPSSSRCDAAGRTSWPRPGRRRSPARSRPPITLEPVVDDIVLLDPVCGMTVDRAHGPPPRRARRGRSTRSVRSAAGPGSSRSRRPILSASCSVPDARLTSHPGGPHAVRRFRPDQGVPREGLGVRHRPEPGRPVRPGRREDRGHRRDPFQGDGQGRDRLHQRPVHRRTWSSPSRSRRTGR